MVGTPVDAEVVDESPDEPDPHEQRMRKRHMAMTETIENAHRRIRSDQDTIAKMLPQLHDLERRMKQLGYEVPKRATVREAPPVETTYPAAESLKSVADKIAARVKRWW